MNKIIVCRIFVVSIMFLITLSPIMVLKAKGQDVTQWAEFKVMGDVPPRATTKPPTTSIQTPQNNTINSGIANISIYSNVTISGDGEALYLKKIHFETDWQPHPTIVYEFIPGTYMNTITEFNKTITIGEIPEGNHTITIFTLERGRYEEPQPYTAGFKAFYYYFSINSSSSLNFTTDKTIPTTTFSLPEDNKYYSSTINLNYTISEKVSQLKYSLDGQDQVNSLFSENLEGNNGTTGFDVIGTLVLSNLTDGKHNVTIYATDLAGHTGVSETIYFTIEPFPTTLVIGAVVVAVIVVLGIFSYRIKTKRRS